MLEVIQFTRRFLIQCRKINRLRLCQFAQLVQWLSKGRLNASFDIAKAFTGLVEALVQEAEAFETESGSFVGGSATENGEIGERLKGKGLGRE